MGRWEPCSCWLRITSKKRSSVFWQQLKQLSQLSRGLARPAVELWMSMPVVSSSQSVACVIMYRSNLSKHSLALYETTVLVSKLDWSFTPWDYFSDWQLLLKFNVNLSWNYLSMHGRLVERWMLNAFLVRWLHNCPLYSLFYTVFLIWKAGSPSLAAMTTTQKEYQGFLQTLTLGHSIFYGGPLSPDSFMMFQGKEATYYGIHVISHFIILSTVWGGKLKKKKKINQLILAAGVYKPVKCWIYLSARNYISKECSVWEGTVSEFSQFMQGA